jgi:hypothetical protein
MHPDEAVIEQDVERIRQLERDNALFEYELEVGQLSISNDTAVSEIRIVTDRPDIY